MKPDFQITVSGTDITDKIADRLVKLSVTDEAGVKSDRIELELDDRDAKIAIPATKTTLSVSIGYVGALVKKGDYVVEEITISGPERRMTIRANATGASKGPGASREKSYDSTTIGKIAREIAGRHKWKAAIAEEIDTIAIEHIVQRESDIQFLARLAGQNNAVAKVTHGKLVIAPHGKGKSVSGKTLPRVTIYPDQVTEWNMTLEERGSYTGVKAKYHDLKNGKRGESLSGTDGDNAHTMPHTYGSKAEADRAVKSKKDSLARGKAKFSISSMPGNPTIEAEGVIVAKGFRDGVDGEWTVTTVTHTISESGYTTAIECELPGK